MLIRAIFWVINKVLQIIGFTLNTLISLFPTSPFTIIKNSQYNQLMSNINYFIPVYEFIVILEGYLIAVGIYYLYSIWARWVKAID